ncbi:class I SAM-dependent methyltransferase [Oxalobacteraceae bacterium]|nr:class I SAM-dependent methyltransferase [Oxalobacteraceae bacterium]
MEPYLLDYLRGVGIVDRVSAATLPCEVCGGAEHAVLVDTVEVGNARFGRLPVVGCANCGYLYQNPRFNQEFYERYYDKYYRLMLFGDSAPEQDFLLDQVRRGEHLYRSLAAQLPKQGRLLDVGCSAGGLMVPFAKRGWEVLGTDPDSTYVEFGKRRLGLRIEAMPAEAMDLPEAGFDLIVITGSLEHVFDVNRVLALCRKACAPDGLLFIEGRALNYGLIKGHFSHNHRRYLSLHTIELLMLKHGWTPILSTEAALCGPTRPGAVHVLGRAGAALDAAALQRQIDGGRRETLAALAERLRPLRGAL